MRHCRTKPELAGAVTHSSRTVAVDSRSSYGAGPDLARSSRSSPGFRSLVIRFGPDPDRSWPQQAGPGPGAALRGYRQGRIQVPRNGGTGMFLRLFASCNTIYINTMYFLRTQCTSMSLQWPETSINFAGRVVL